MELEQIESNKKITIDTTGDFPLQHTEMTPEPATEELSKANTDELMPVERHNEDPRGDGWFVVRSGLKFFPLNPREEDILIQDIAFALSNICRFGGHVQFTSVAEHCCRVSDHLPANLKLLGLLHDAEEAYIGDCVRPLKYQMPNYIEAGNNLWKVIASRFNLPQKNPRDIPEIKEADDMAMLAERNHLMPPGQNTRNWYWDSIGMEPLNCRIRCWSPEVARREFMNRFTALTQTK